MWNVKSDFNVNFLCQNVITEIDTQSPKQKWYYNITVGPEIKNSSGGGFADIIRNQTPIIDQNIWMMGTPQTALPDSRGFYSTSCMGSRPFNKTSFFLTEIKVNSTIPFNAGYTAFRDGRLLASGEGQAY